MRPKPQQMVLRWDPQGQSATIGVSHLQARLVPLQTPAARSRMWLVMVTGGCAWGEGCHVELCQLDTLAWAMVSLGNGAVWLAGSPSSPACSGIPVCESHKDPGPSSPPPSSPPPATPIARAGRVPNSAEQRLPPGFGLGGAEQRFGERRVGMQPAQLFPGRSGRGSSCLGSLGSCHPLLLSVPDASPVPPAPPFSA